MVSIGKTSTEAKRRWNNANYTRIVANVPKTIAENFREKCKREGISQAQIIKDAIDAFLADDAPQK